MDTIPDTNDNYEIGNENFAVHTDFLAKSTLDAGKDNNGRPTTMYDNVGKYFDPFEFNKNFDKYIKTVEESRLVSQSIDTNELTNMENVEVKPYQLPISKILINTKRTWFNIFKGNVNGFDNNQLFYIASTFLVIAVLYILLSYIFT